MTETEQFVYSISYHCFEFVFLVTRSAGACAACCDLFVICDLEFGISPINRNLRFAPTSFQNRVLITAWAVFENRDGWAPDPVPSPPVSDSSNIADRKNVLHPDS